MGNISGECISVYNDTLLNKGTQREALKFVLDVEVKEGLVLPVDFFVNKFTPNGNANPIFAETKKTYETIMTREDNGEGEKVNCMVRFEPNTYVNKDGEIVHGTLNNSIIFCTREEKSKFPIQPDNKGKFYGLFKGYEKSEDGTEMTLQFLVNNYAYVNKEGEIKASGFILDVMIHDNEDYMAYVEEELKVNDILYFEVDVIKEVLKAKKSRGIGTKAKSRAIIKNYLELTFCSEPLGSINEDGELIKNEFEDLSDDEDFYLAIDREDFPFTPEYIAVMEDTMEASREKLEAKAEEIKANAELNADNEVGDDETPF